MVNYEAKAEVTGMVWKITAGVGDTVDEGSTIMILESMKMEIPVLADDAGTVLDLLVSEGESVTEGQPVAIIEES